jgi:hypothetical protein
MRLRDKVFTLEVEAPNADFDNDLYYQLYAVSATSVTVNGFSVSLEADSELNLIIKSISSTPGVFLLGEKKYAVNPPTTLNKYPEP